MSVFNLEDKELYYIGKVQAVDTASVAVKVENEEALSSIQINDFVIIQASKTRQTLIGTVTKIIRTNNEIDESLEDDFVASSNDIVKINLIGTVFDKKGIKENVFKRALKSVPKISSEVYIMNEENLSSFMSVISSTSADGDTSFNIGTYTLNKYAKAYLDGNRFFQKHAVIVGSTGSGKSCTVATIIQQVAKLKSANAILFDIHGEYAPIVGDTIKHYKIAGPTDRYEEGILFLPYWLLTYEEMLSMLLDRSDSNAPNQAMLFRRTVLSKKKEFLETCGHGKIVEGITIDSPVPYKMGDVLDKFNQLNNEMVPGSKSKPKKGSYNGILTRFLQRLENKVGDKRLNFMFCKDGELLKYEYIDLIFKKLMLSASNGGGIKIIDFSEVPSDILPLIVSLTARLVFTVQQWIDKEQIQPIALFCDEAHLYMPQDVRDGVESISLNSFERIAKEGRKYGVSLVVITQRPSEVDRTVLSQINNFIAMRLTNSEDQNVIKKLLPDSSGSYCDILPILDVGEAIVVGDASLLPSRILINRPQPEPNSSTVKFWNEWSKETTDITVIPCAVERMIKQSKD